MQQAFVIILTCQQCIDLPLPQMKKALRSFLDIGSPLRGIVSALLTSNCNNLDYSQHVARVDLGNLGMEPGKAKLKAYAGAAVWILQVKAKSLLISLT